MQIIKKTDRIKVEIDEIVFHLSTLTFEQKTEIQALIVQAIKGNDNQKVLEATRLAIRYTVKDVTGLVDGDDVWKPEIDNGCVTDDSLDILLNLPLSQKLCQVASTLAVQIPKDSFLDETGKGIEGVKLLKKK